jgi:hypothetical protein
VRLVKLFWSTLQKGAKSDPSSDGTYNVRSQAYEVTVKIFDAFEQTRSTMAHCRSSSSYPTGTIFGAVVAKRNVATIHSSSISKGEDTDSSTHWIRYRQMSVGIPWRS